MLFKKTCVVFEIEWWKIFCLLRDLPWGDKDIGGLSQNKNKPFTLCHVLWPPVSIHYRDWIIDSLASSFADENQNCVSKLYQTPYNPHILPSLQFQFIIFSALMAISEHLPSYVCKLSILLAAAAKWGTKRHHCFLSIKKGNTLLTCFVIWLMLFLIKNKMPYKIA